jgi:hypothetical protein
MLGTLTRHAFKSIIMRTRCKKDCVQGQTYSPNFDRLSMKRLRGSRMLRREFIAGIGSAAVWPLAVRAQQGARKRSIAVLLPLVENDPSARAKVAAFATALQQAGWTDSNARIEIRWAGPIPSEIGRHAAELVHRFLGTDHLRWIHVIDDDLYPGL